MTALGTLTVIFHSIWPSSGLYSPFLVMRACFMVSV